MVGKNTNRRRPVVTLRFQNVELRQRKLIGQGEPAEFRADVGEPIGAVDFLEAVERSLRATAVEGLA